MSTVKYIAVQSVKTIDKMFKILFNLIGSFISTYQFTNPTDLFQMINFRESLSDCELKQKC